MCERSQKLLLLNLLAHSEWECHMGVKGIVMAGALGSPPQLYLTSVGAK